MANIEAVTQKLSALELKKQPNVPKLLTKFVVPHPHQASKIAPSQSGKKPALSRQPQAQTQPPTKIALKPNMDIGKYDGGFELDDKKRGEKVYGEAAEALALDSSVSGYVVLLLCFRLTNPRMQKKPHTRVEVDSL
jgi:aurora kinase